MKYSIVIAQTADDTFKDFNARWQAILLRAMREHLEYEPTKESKSRIKRLRGLRRPQYRLRVDEVRIFYDVNAADGRVEVLGFVFKEDTAQWLTEHGVPQ